MALWEDNVVVDKLMDLIFSSYVPKFEFHKIWKLFKVFKNCISHDPALEAALTDIGYYLTQYYVVHWSQRGRQYDVRKIFKGRLMYMLGGDLLLRQWFLPLTTDPRWVKKDPREIPRLRVLFTEEWRKEVFLHVKQVISDVVAFTPHPHGIDSLVEIILKDQGGVEAVSEDIFGEVRGCSSPALLKMISDSERPLMSDGKRKSPAAPQETSNKRHKGV